MLGEHLQNTIFFERSAVTVQRCLHYPAAGLHVVKWFCVISVNAGLGGYLKGFTVFGVGVQDQIENLFSIFSVPRLLAHNDELIALAYFVSAYEQYIA